MTLLAIIALVVALLGGGAGVIAVRQKRSFVKANEVVPGRATAAPAAWAGSHSPEAKLHRRLTDAVAALRANATLSDGAFMESRATIEQTALAIDERLIAAAALPASHRNAAIAAVAPAVAALEDAVAALAAPAAAGSDQQALDDSVRAANIRIQALAAARTELDLFDQTVTRSQLDDAPAQTQPAQTQPPEGTTRSR